MTLAQLRETIRLRSDMLHTEYVSDDELNTYINLSLKELYGLLVETFQNYFVTSQTTTVAANEQSFALPTDSTKVIGVDAKTGENTWVTLRHFEFMERNLYQPPNQGMVSQYWSNIRYQLRDDSIYLNPAPGQSADIKVWYIPELEDLVEDTDSPPRNMNLFGWLQYVISDVALQVLQKQEQDVSIFAAEKAALINRINAEAQNRDTGWPTTVSDVYSTGNSYISGVGGGWGYGGGGYY